MERVELKNTSFTPHFIGAWNLEPEKLCDEIINYFELNSHKQKKGRASDQVNENFKKSVDISINPNEIDSPKNEVFKTYFEALYTCHKDYFLQWPFLGSFASKLEIGVFNIQRYQAGEHFQQIHTERASIATLHRILAWMTYLNDVEEGGTTFFSHYGLEIKPRKG